MTEEASTTLEIDESVLRLNPCRGKPLVSVVILTYKRREALVRVLDSVREQEYPHREIIVVDNNSQDGLRQFLAEKAPGVRLLELTGNFGACRGRNVGINEARGDIIITLDNDMFFDSPFELRKAVNTFEARPEIHMLAFQVCDPRTGALRLREWCHPRNWKEYGTKEFETDFFIEGACACRREVYEKAGLYYEPLFIGCEEHDLALRILDHGFRILYCPRVRVRHLMSSDTRTPGRFFYFYTRNYIWIAYKDYPLLEGARFLIPKLAMVLLFALRTGGLMPFFRGLWEGVRGLKAVRRDRTPISGTTARRLADIEKGRPGLFFRLARHKEQPQV